MNCQGTLSQEEGQGDDKEVNELGRDPIEGTLVPLPFRLALGSLVLHHSIPIHQAILT